MAERTRLTGGRCLCLAGAETWTAPSSSQLPDPVERMPGPGSANADRAATCEARP